MGNPAIYKYYTYFYISIYLIYMCLLQILTTTQHLHYTIINLVQYIAFGSVC